MSSSDFRQIAAKTETGRSERLFRAAVSAFCSLTRPTRSEISQLEDLVLPLFDCVSKEALRYVAAALSENQFAPEALVQRLADQPVDVAAPLLIRSKALNDVDLIALIGRHGIPHARAIARREDLNPVIDDLVRALLATAAREIDLVSTATTVRAVPNPIIALIDAEMPEAPIVEIDTLQVVVQPEPVEDFSETLPALPADVAANDATPLAEAVVAPRKTFGKADKVRDQLRAMMLPSEEPQEFNAVLELAPILSDAELWRLRETALTGNHAFFETALADALGIDYAQARTICGATGYGDLLFALKSLEIAQDTAFLITAANYPSSFGHAEAIRLFLERYHLCHPEAARDKVRAWKADSIATAVRRAKPKRKIEIANADQAPTETRKAS